MANIYINLPTTVGNGAGAATDVSTMGAVKTIVIGGNARATIEVQVNNAAVSTDGSWQAVASFQNSGQLTVRVAARWMRVVTSGYDPFVGGQATADVGGTDIGATFATLVAPAGDGSGVSVNTSALGLFKSVQVSGVFRGAVVIEVSEDGTTWGQPFSFQAGGIQSAIIAAEFMRVTRNGVPLVSPGLPVVNVGATDDVSGDDGVAISAGTQSVATGTVVFSNSNGVSFGMSNSSVVTASVDALKSITAGTTNATGPGISFGNGSGVSFGMTGNTITASVAAGGALAAIAAGTQTATSGSIVFSNSNGVSFGMSNSSVVTAAIPAVSALSGLAAGTQTATSGTVVFSNSNGISFGLSGSSRVTASYASYISQFALYPEVGIQWAATTNTMSVWPVSIPDYVSATQVAMLMSMNQNSNSSGAISLSLGIYTLSGVTASLATSASRQVSWTSGSATDPTSSQFGGASGYRYRSMSGNFNMTPGLYLFAAHVQTNNVTSVTLAGAGGLVAINGPYDGIENSQWVFGISNSSFTSAMPTSIAATNTNYQRTGFGIRIPALWFFGTT